LRLGRAHDGGVEHLRVRDHARLRSVPALPGDVVDQGLFVEGHALVSLNWNQKNPLGARVSRYGSSPTGGKLVRPNISSGTIPAKAERSSWTACAERATLWTQSTVSSSQRRMWAKIFGLSDASGSYVPRPKTGCSLRSATKRCSQRRNEFGVRSCASTF